jgi:hypothetical protein
MVYAMDRSPRKGKETKTQWLGQADGRDLEKINAYGQAAPDI